MPMETRKSSRDKTSVENLELSTGLSSNICNSGLQEGESGQQVSASAIDNLRIFLESTPPLAKFSEWSPKEVKNSNQSTSNARPAMHCRLKNKFAIPRKIILGPIKK